MKEYDVVGTLVEKFKGHISSMHESVSDDEPTARAGEEKLYVKVYRAGDEHPHPLKKISFMRLEDGRIKNKDDKNRLDPGEFTVITFISHDQTALPLCAMEVSFHFESYIQCRIDLPPLSVRKEYREIFCKPVQDLRRGIDHLPGLAPLVALPGLEDFSSGGLLTGHFRMQDKETLMQCFHQYADLYRDFVDGRNDLALLKDPSLLEESRLRRASFCQLFSKMTPRILSDIPHLYSPELGGKLGEILF